MEISSLMDERNTRLYKGISKRVEIELKENPDWRAEAWSSYINNKTATVLYCESSQPIPDFTKELLRIQAQLNGFKLLADGQTTNSRSYENMQTIIKSLNHHFLNHKIAREFIALGYSLEQLQEDDEGTVNFLKDQLAQSGHSALKLSLFYLLSIDPLASATENDRRVIQGLFNQYDGGKFTTCFQCIDKIVQDWALTDTYFAEKYMIDFLINAGVTDTWFSYQTQAPVSNEKDFSEDGFYVN